MTAFDDYGPDIREIKRRLDKIEDLLRRHMVDPEWLDK